MYLSNDIPAEILNQKPCAGTMLFPAFNYPADLLSCITYHEKLQHLLPCLWVPRKLTRKRSTALLHMPCITYIFGIEKNIYVPWFYCFHLVQVAKSMYTLDQQSMPMTAIHLCGQLQRGSQDLVFLPREVCCISHGHLYSSGNTVFSLFPSSVWAWPIPESVCLTQSRTKKLKNQCRIVTLPVAGSSLYELGAQCSEPSRDSKVLISYWFESYFTRTFVLIQR